MTWFLEAMCKEWQPFQVEITISSSRELLERKPVRRCRRSHGERGLQGCELVLTFSERMVRCRLALLRALHRP